MENISRTLFIPLYGKSQVSRKGIILDDPDAERIWEKESFPIRGKSRSKWLAYNMAMRARVFDEWTEDMLKQYPEALVLHAGCGLDSRCHRVRTSYMQWLDCDLPPVIEVRRKYFCETASYHMISLNAADSVQTDSLPDSDTAIVVMEGLSMYLRSDQLHGFLQSLRRKYVNLHILMDIYTVFGAKASRFKNPVNDVGVTELYGIDDLQKVLGNLKIRFKAEYSFTPSHLISQLQPAERVIFRLLFSGRIYRKIYRLIELESVM